MYVRRIQEQTLEFGHRGWLLDESFIFYDKQSDSLWVQATGVCIRGKYKGEQLTALPVTHTTWGEWRALHPETRVLEKPEHLIARYRSDAYAHYYTSRRTKFGLVVFVGSRQELFPIERLEENPVLHHEIAGQPVLVVFHAPSRTAVAFDPVVDGKEVRFELAKSTDDEILLRDPASLATWSGLTGRPHPATDSRPALRQLRTTQFVVDNWSNHFPDSPIFSSP